MNERAPSPWRTALTAAAVLGFFAVLGSALVGVAYQGTAERIAQSEREALLRQLNAILARHEYDNDLLNDYLDVSAPKRLGAETTRVYRARRQGKPVALILSPVVAQGYSGAIDLIVGIRVDGTLAGVRVLSHKETPGLGDRIDERKSPWILGFSGKSLDEPPLSRWRVKRDGGDFDQFTGATITPRAVVAAVKEALLWYRAQGPKLFEVPPQVEKTRHE
ncbi:MAG: electron transport complex subunit RsxG [Gammaproteobacteria bacterium]|nr:MAG: electron transport complex subunit RsxG [Gammaproteobacteria bacterium]